MIEDAIKSRIPLIACRTTDTINIPLTLQYISGEEPERWVKKNDFSRDTVYWHVKTTNSVFGGADVLYKKLVNLNSILIIFNMKEIPDEFFDVGSFPVPENMIKDKLNEVFKDEEYVERLIPSLGGLTLKEIGEVIRITRTRENGDIQPAGLMRTRRESILPSKGLSMVNTELPVYMPHAMVEQIANKEKDWFFGNVDRRLRPRGFLADGDPGTGKTQSAKFLANAWEVPLFHLDSSVQGRFVGQSEEDMLQALDQVDREEPCILLIDEVEKMFRGGSGGDYSGITSKLLGIFLWWLQEHTSKVFVIMTCNRKELIPKELYRPGRLDTIIVFQGLKKSSAMEFVDMVAGSFGKWQKNGRSLAETKVNMLYDSVGGESSLISQAQLSELVFSMVKEGNIKT